MTILQEGLKANEAYAASFGAKSQLALLPARRFAILPAWMHVSIPQNMLDFRKETHT
jgi:hypothetical protein